MSNPEEIYYHNQPADPSNVGSSQNKKLSNSSATKSSSNSQDSGKPKATATIETPSGNQERSIPKSDPSSIRSREEKGSPASLYPSDVPLMQSNDMRASGSSVQHSHPQQFGAIPQHQGVSQQVGSYNNGDPNNNNNFIVNNPTPSGPFKASPAGRNQALPFAVSPQSPGNNAGSPSNVPLGAVPGQLPPNAASPVNAFPGNPAPNQMPGHNNLPSFNSPSMAAASGGAGPSGSAGMGVQASPMVSFYNSSVQDNNAPSSSPFSPSPHNNNQFSAHAALAISPFPQHVAAGMQVAPVMQLPGPFQAKAGPFHDQQFQPSHDIHSPSYPFFSIKNPIRVDMRITEANKSKNSFNTLWDDMHLKLPCSDCNRMYKPSDISSGPIKRWKVIRQTFKTTPRSPEELEAAIRRYNPTWSSKVWHSSFDTLRAFASQCRDFFGKGSVLEFIIEMALQMPKLFPGNPPLLRQQVPMEVVFSQKQCLCLVANMFLCTFPRRTPYKAPFLNEYRVSDAQEYPNVGFDGIFIGYNNSKIEKLKCIAAYFRQHKMDTKNELNGPVTFRRQVLTPADGLYFFDSTAPISSCTPVMPGAIEDQFDAWQADFANALVGGGVLGRGSVQEEIRMIVAPELIVSRLITQRLEMNESLVMIGSQRYSSHTGYMDSFRFVSNFDDPSRNSGNPTVVTAFDAVDYSKDDPAKQYKHDSILRELIKATIAFAGLETEKSPIATGNWGCGAFKGDKYLKFLIQIVSSSIVGRDIRYISPTHDLDLGGKITKFQELVQKTRPTVHDILESVLKFIGAPIQSDAIEYVNKDMEKKMQANAFVAQQKQNMMFQQQQQQYQMQQQNNNMNMNMNNNHNNNNQPFGNMMQHQLQHFPSALPHQQPLPSAFQAFPSHQQQDLQQHQQGPRQPQFQPHQSSPFQATPQSHPFPQFPSMASSGAAPNLPPSSNVPALDSHTPLAASGNSHALEGSAMVLDPVTMNANNIRFNP